MGWHRNGKRLLRDRRRARDERGGVGRIGEREAELARVDPLGQEVGWHVSIGDVAHGDLLGGNALHRYDVLLHEWLAAVRARESVDHLFVGEGVCAHESGAIDRDAKAVQDVASVRARDLRRERWRRPQIAWSR